LSSSRLDQSHSLCHYIGNIEISEVLRRLQRRSVGSTPLFNLFLQPTLDSLTLQLDLGPYQIV